ncbi:Nnt1p [Histomonas meleagridis]|uniref:Nnt1p n=1 Tax=Histomonas meleagridis TaxID=135588 RepID=UPI003559B4B0|nr:Nnt1p [Histomonas meleagridis]KAH0803879.1 Nnt1p [Histomonas meleagridis]
MSDFAELFDQGPEEEEQIPEYPVINWDGINLRLLNVHHSLWGDKLWEAGKIMGRIIKEHLFNISVEGKTVVEFGAGAGLSTICCSLAGASNVVSTDYPDANLIENLEFNVLKYPNVKVVGHQWGKDISPVLAANNNDQFDVAILADLVFNHTCHSQLLQSLSGCLKRTGFAIVTFTHHRTHLVKEDLHFFKLAKKKFGFNVEELGTMQHPPMFKDDFGPIEIRSTAHICKLTYADEQMKQ